MTTDIFIALAVTPLAGQLMGITSSNAQVISQKRSARTKTLSNVPENATTAQAVYLKASAAEIVERIGADEWTAKDVLEAYIARAAFAHAQTNCLTEIMFESARKRAAELDLEFAATKKLKGPLHGVPVSLKDQFDVLGYDSTIGFSAWANKPAKNNADIVNALLDAGAVIFVKTNLPQTVFGFECSNPVWGRTTNPWNNKFTPGGSSGGEAALLAMDGSAAGIGTDIGGSLRIPAAYCGVYSLKPGSGRTSYFGAQDPVPGFNGIPSISGPIARSVQDLELLSKALFGRPSTDGLVAPVPFRDTTLPNKLRFGYYTSDNYVKASPACKRAVLETVEALRVAGHECVEFELPESGTPFYIFVGISSADGYKTMLSHLGPDPKENVLFLVTLGPKLPSFLRNALAWAAGTLMGDELFANAARASRKKNVTQYYKLMQEKLDYSIKFQKEVWDKYQLDSIIAPVQAVPQLPHGGCDKFSAMGEATSIYNILDLPTGCLPVTRVDPSKDQVTNEWVDGPGLGSRMLETGIYRDKPPLYDPQQAKGMPVGIQVVGRKWEEEKVLGLMKVIDEALGRERGFGPGTWASSV